MSEELIARFEQAAEEVTKLSEKPDSSDLLRLYALYKQGKEGDCTGDRPGMLDFVKRAKYDGWKALAGTSKEEAMQMYIDVVNELKEKDAG
jgi:acyl-CoA-binding protein